MSDTNLIYLNESNPILNLFQKFIYLFIVILPFIFLFGISYSIFYFILICGLLAIVLTRFLVMLRLVNHKEKFYFEFTFLIIGFFRIKRYYNSNTISYSWKKEVVGKGSFRYVLRIFSENIQIFSDKSFPNDLEEEECKKIIDAIDKYQSLPDK